MDNVTPDLDTLGVTIGLGTIAFVGVAAAVLLARAVRPAVERLADVDLGAVTSAFGAAVTRVSEIQANQSARSVKN